MIKKYLLPSLFAFVVTLGLAPKASAAPLVINLASNVFAADADPDVIFNAVPGSTASLDVTLDNSGNDVPLFINGSNFNIDSPLTLNDLLFANFPASIAADAAASGTLFSIDLPADLAPGLYNGFYSVLGGFTPDDQFDLADISFQVDVQPSVAPVPEPATWALLSTGIGALGTLYSRRRRDA